MYYEEQIIDGKLCYKNDPDAEFTAYTYEQLLLMYVEAKKSMEVYGGRLSKIYNFLRGKDTL